VAVNPPVPLYWLMIGKRKPPARFDRPQAFDNESALGSETASFPPLGYSMSLPAVSIAHVRKTLRRFRRNRRGSAAVEFALVAPLFFALLFAIIETALVFFASQVLETVAQEAARTILTGQAQNAGYQTESDFKSKVICPTGNVANVLFDCTNGIFVDVQSYSAFGNVTLNSQIDAGNNFINNMKYCPGNAGDIVVVRVFYQWQLFVTGLGYNIANLTGSRRLLSATAAFRNEPFVANPAPCN
jgi:Flp pilus assembly protein TadG